MSDWQFYGRTTELDELSAILCRQRWFFAKITGRRRIGKATLIQQAVTVWFLQALGRETDCRHQPFHRSRDKVSGNISRVSRLANRSHRDRSAIGCRAATQFCFTRHYPAGPDRSHGWIAISLDMSSYRSFWIKREGDFSTVFPLDLYFSPTRPNEN